MGGLDPRALAALGIGYGAALVARLGIWPAESTQPAGGFVPLPLREPKRRPKEEEEAFLLAVLL
jgi:hypothetical protein